MLIGDSLTPKGWQWFRQLLEASHIHSPCQAVSMGSTLSHPIASDVQLHEMSQRQFSNPECNWHMSRVHTAELSYLLSLVAGSRFSPEPEAYWFETRVQDLFNLLAKPLINYVVLELDTPFSHMCMSLLDCS